MKDQFSNQENHEIFDSFCNLKSKVVNLSLVVVISDMKKKDFSKLEIIKRMKFASSTPLAMFDWEKIFSNDGWKCIMECVFILQGDNSDFCKNEFEIIKKYFSNELEMIQNSLKKRLFPFQKIN